MPVRVADPTEEDFDLNGEVAQVAELAFVVSVL
jgi:hypothetical protein